MEVRRRAAVRVVCVDCDGRLLLLHWHDPVDGAEHWEPPGGGIEPGESPYEAARRELTEETGLDPDAIREQFVTVERDLVWKGRRMLGPEQFFLARYPASAPELVPEGLLPDEVENLAGLAWHTPGEIRALAEVQPPELLAVLAELESGELESMLD
ncbi:MAG: pyrophosphohydrolase [Actinomycetia bacterium]|nr:pyrophosphohydrolase [Actinomycetes bacterium]